MNACLQRREKSLNVVGLKAHFVWTPLPAVLDEDLVAALQSMLLRLKTGGPRVVSSSKVKCWHIFTNVACEQSTQCGGLGGVFFDNSANVCSWFGIEVSQATSKLLGAKESSL